MYTIFAKGQETALVQRVFFLWLIFLPSCVRTGFVGPAEIRCSEHTDCPDEYLCLDNRCRHTPDPLDAGLVLADASSRDSGFSDRPVLDAKRADVNLADVNLADVNLADANLADVNLADANLADVNLADANLADVNLADVNLADVNLADANLADVNLADVNLADVNLADVNLADANLADANLADVNLADVNLADANLADVNLADVNLADVNLADVNLADVNLEDAGALTSYVWTSQGDFASCLVRNQVDVTQTSEVVLADQQHVYRAKIDSNARDASNDSNRSRIDQCYFSNNTWGDSAGLQWPLDVPQGAVVSQAFFTVYDEAHGHDTQLGDCPEYSTSIQVEDIDNAPEFSASISETVSDRGYWSESVPWFIAHGGLGAAAYHQSPSLLGLVQHIVDRAGWQSGNYIGFMIAGGGAVGDPGCSEELHDYNHNGSSTPEYDSELRVEFLTHQSAGSIFSPLVDSGSAGTQWLDLQWGADVPAGTEISVFVRTSASPFAVDNTTLAWQNFADLPAQNFAVGQFLQWRVDLQSSTGVDTPALQEMRLVGRR